MTAALGVGCFEFQRGYKIFGGDQVNVCWMQDTEFFIARFCGIWYPIGLERSKPHLCYLV